MKYLLDTDICIYIARKKTRSLLERFERLQAGEAGMSVITYMELTYGAQKSERINENLTQIESLASALPVLPLEANVAKPFGEIRCAFERRGVPIGGYDLLIAAHALALKMTLVTNNVKEFSRVTHLKVERWM